jgi:hypothetical protein
VGEHIAERLQPFVSLAPAESILVTVPRTPHLPLPRSERHREVPCGHWFFLALDLVSQRVDPLRPLFASDPVAE